MTYRETDLLPDFPEFPRATPRAPEVVVPLLAVSVRSFTKAARGGAITTVFAGLCMAAGIFVPKLVALMLLGGVVFLIGAVVWLYGASNVRDMRLLLVEGTAHEGSVAALGHTTQEAMRGSPHPHDGPYLGEGTLLTLWVTISYEDERGSHKCRLDVDSHEAMATGTRVAVLRRTKDRAQVAIVGPSRARGAFGVGLASAA